MDEGPRRTRRHVVLNADEWRRASRGRHRVVPGLTAAGIPELLERLPWQYRPYVLVATDKVLSGKKYVSGSRLVDASSIGDLLSEGVWDYFVLSERLSPALVGMLPWVDDKTLATNGALNLQFGRTGATRSEPPASLGLVSRVATNDGRYLEHHEYLAVFDAAVRAARSHARGRKET